jgi:3-keto-5-aminohexanoate cleavage enzyme
MEPVIVQAALTGAISTTDQNSNLPTTVEEIVHAGIEAWRAGASVLHIHAREEDGEPTQRLERFEPVVHGLRDLDCSAIINLSTGSAAGRADGKSRYECLRLQPEMGSFDCGSFNFGERLFANPMSFLRDMAKEFAERVVKPEIECFDVGHIGTALQLRDEGLLEEPMTFQFVLGVRGGAPATPEQALYMRSLLPRGATWSICAVGRHQLPMNLLCLSTDGHVRTGLEDNLNYLQGVRAESNAQLVARIVRIAEEIGRPVATPDEARELLALPTRPSDSELGIVPGPS